MKAYSPTQPCRVAVMLSGRGSNFISLLQDSQLSDSPYRIAWVFSDRAEAPGLLRAREAGLPTHTASPGQFASKAAFECDLVARLRQQRIDLICLAGYMRIVGGELLSAFPEQILNVHPALLPSFPGLHAQRQALAYGVRVSGCTVHLVDAGTDTGPIVGQVAVEVGEDDSEETLAARILVEEHRLFPQAVRRICAGGLRIENHRLVACKRK